MNLKMHLHDLKIYAVNIIAFISIYTSLDAFLKILLVLASLVYTIVKIKNELKPPKK